MHADDSHDTPTLTALPGIAALRAGHDDSLDLWVRLRSPRSMPLPTGRRAPAPWLSAVRLYLRPSAGVSVTLLDAHPSIGAPTGELGWLLPDVPSGGEADALFRLRVDRGLTVAGTAAPLLWLRVMALDARGARRSIAAPALVLPALPVDHHDRLPPHPAVARRVAGHAGPVDACGQR
ncbi:MAG: hypothetical protein EHM87_11720 [Burkholderiales bacterium]|nr:MAG: hypothetical protein EHM87_11720 [Burkholderiales bacterium]